MRSVALGVLLALSASAIARGQALRGQELAQALDDEAASFWIYDDLAAATARATELGKPMLVSFRCVP